MTSYTRYYGLPHPTATKLPDGTERFNDDANGARDLQALADAADRQLDRIDGLWVTELNRGGFITKLSADITGFAANTFTPFNTDVLVRGTGGMSSTQGFLGGPAGWWHIQLSVSTIPAGASNGVRRALRARITEDTPRGIEGVETYFQEEFEAGTQTVNQLGFVTYLDPVRSLEVAFFHNNTSSTITVKNTATFFSGYRIGPRT